MRRLAPRRGATRAIQSRAVRRGQATAARRADPSLPTLRTTLGGHCAVRGYVTHITRPLRQQPPLGCLRTGLLSREPECALCPLCSRWCNCCGRDRAALRMLVLFTKDITRAISPVTLLTGGSTSPSSCCCALDLSTRAFEPDLVDHGTSAAHRCVPVVCATPKVHSVSRLRGREVSSRAAPGAALLAPRDLDDLARGEDSDERGARPSMGGGRQ